MPPPARIWRGRARNWRGIAMRTELACLALLCGCAAAQSLPELENSARQAMRAGNAEAALSAYEQLARANPKSAAYEDQIGFLLAATKRVNEAIPHLQRATELDPKMAAAWYHLGGARYMTQQPEAAMRAMERAVALAPDNAEYRSHLGAVCETVGNGFLQEHKYKQAREPYRHAVALLPENALLRNS